MSKRISIEEAIIGYFRDASQAEAVIMQAAIRATVTGREFADADVPKRGRPPGARNKAKSAVAEMPAPAAG